MKSHVLHIVALAGVLAIAAVVLADPPPIPPADQVTREALGGIGDFRGFCTSIPAGNDLFASPPAWLTDAVAAKARYVTVTYASTAASLLDDTDRGCFTLGGASPGLEPCIGSGEWAQQLLPNQTVTILLRPNSSTGELQPLWASLEGTNRSEGGICLGVAW